MANRNGKPKKAGIVMKYHDAGLKAISKMRKGTWQTIILKEMTSCNTYYRSLIAFDEPSCVAALEAISDALHLTTWATAKSGKPIIDTRWLQALGVSKAGFERIRRWIFEYHIYDVSDHGFVDEIFELYQHRPLDYLILRAYLLLHEHYANERLFFLPIDRVISQTLALRRRFGIPAHADTPPLLGVCYMCDRCESWANPVVEPPYVAQHGRVRRHAINATASPLAGEEKSMGDGDGDDEAEYEEYEENEDDEDEEDGDGAHANDSVEAAETAKQVDKRNKETEALRRKKVTQSTYMSKAWFDPLTIGAPGATGLFCRRKHLAEHNPIDIIYQHIDELVRDDEAEAQEDAEDGAPKKAKAKRGKKHSSVALLGLHEASTAAPDAAEDGESSAEDEDDAIFRLLENMSLESGAINFRGLERFAEQVVVEDGSADPLGGTTTHASAESMEPRTIVSAEATAATTGRQTRKMDPVDTYLVRYFKRNNGGALKRVDMIGIWRRTKKGIFGLCDECGAMTQIENNRMTNTGTSCLHHVTSNMAVDHPIRCILEQRQWKKMRLQPNKGTLVTSPTASTTPLPPLQPPPSILAAVARGERVPGVNVLRRLHPVRNAHGDIIKCLYCRHHDAEHRYVIYDSLVNLCHIPLCDVDHSHVLRTIPRGVIPSAQRLMEALARTSTLTHAASSQTLLV